MVDLYIDDDHLKKAGVGVSVLLVLVLTFFGGATLLDDNSDVSENTYYCEARDLVSQCDSLSFTHKSCYYQNEYDDRKSKRCTEGWERVIDDRFDPEPEPVVISSTWKAQQWNCDVPAVGCVEV
jgi:hypothetical protein